MRGTPADEERLRRLEDAIERLREDAEAGTVVVEGASDVAALEWLGIGGLHVAVHRGRPLSAVIEDLARRPPPVILMPDWDRTGGRLLKALTEGLVARVRLDVEHRRRLAAACRTRALEEVPAELRALRRAVHGEGHLGRGHA